ncbi:phospholipase A and acyltransferase 4-like [Triplophysa dalaica]|uniref:phospholipase A and acyltransferase 4-like n=1 Tax=Triplophysa dalaica TaxID=1582913 RepID=UPI0024E02DBB|nr:phospholipase A and acyltransferase 4-like [Triplophysa dalaica]XP_056627629.1 phospholipase A and acyltransferase 4-like [Triplophysa dalaica]XP_056628178.1 phospholipase A and acyltransferase 4-like [Triplophysa dalaica]
MNFGDLISYRRPGYTHWAVFTGKNEKGQDTVVEFAGESGLNSKAGAKVKEGLLQPGGKVDNQLDSKLPRKSDSEMKATIKEMMGDGAGKYGVLDNNCEHLVTRIRYGIPRSLQAEKVIESNVQFHGNLTSELSDTFGATFHPPSPLSKFK